MKTIFRRELASFFHSPGAYAFIGVFLALSGVIFYLYNIQNLSGDVLTFLSQLTLLVMLLCPVLTMRLLCEEKQKKTELLMMTAPVSLGEIVVGKYLAAAVVMVLTVVLTNGFLLMIPLCGGTLYFGEWFTGYLGFTLQSLSFLAVDLLVTCFAKGPLTGAVLGFGVNFVLWMADLLTDSISWDWLKDALNFLSLYNRYEIFRIGHFSFAATLYFLTFIACCLVVSVRILDARRFDKGGIL